MGSLGDVFRGHKAFSAMADLVYEHSAQSLSSRFSMVTPVLFIAQVQCACRVRMGTANGVVSCVPDEWEG